MTELLAFGDALETSVEMIGDVLVAFGCSGSAPPRRSSDRCSEEARGHHWMVTSDRPGERWKGFPRTFLRTSQATVWLMGEIYGPNKSEDVVRSLGERGGLDRVAPEKWNGHFLVFAWDASRGAWHAWTDRFGSIHAYRSESGARAAIGTFFPSVAASGSRRQLDWEALAGFFAFGFFPGDRTFFDDIRILRPASHYVFDASGHLEREERYWVWRHVPDRRRSYSCTVDAFADVLHCVLDEQASHGRLAIPISGGLDSRTTVAAITRRGAPRGKRLWSYSYGYGPDSIETRIGSEVARARDLPFEALTVGPYLFDQLGSVVSSVEGFQDVTQARQAVVSGLLAGKADAVLAAHWGDVWLDDMGLVEVSGPTEAQVADHAFRKMAKSGRRWLLDRIVAGRLAGNAESLLRGRVAEELSRLGEIQDPDFRVKAYKTEQWSFRWTLASLRMYQAGAFPRLPFYDTRMTDFFASVPSEFVRGRRLQIDYLKRFAPDLARIDWQAYGTNLYRYRYFDSLLLPARAVQKVTRMLRGQPAPQRNWEVQFLGATNRRRLEEALLARGGRLRDLVPESAIRSLLESFYAAPFEEGRGYSVSMLLTFASWMETYG